MFCWEGYNFMQTLFCWIQVQSLEFLGSMFGELKRERMSILKEIELINSLEQSGNMIEDLKSLRASRKLKPEQILLRKRWFGGRKQSEMG